jgi:hypothetical protein
MRKLIFQRLDPLLLLQSSLVLKRRFSAPPELKKSVKTG